MRCTCERDKETKFFHTDTCLIHGPGGLRDYQRETYNNWIDNHPIRAFLYRVECHFRYGTSIKRDRL